MARDGSFATTTRRCRWVAICVAAGLGACGAQSNGPEATERALREAARAVPEVADLNVTRDGDDNVIATGKLDGTSFAARFPRSWNKRAVQWAHGYQLPAPGVVEKPAVEFLNESPALVAFADGYAVATTSYEKVGYAVKSGIERHTRLRELLVATGSERTYMMGESMGGNVVVGLIEKRPDDFAGAVTGCGVVGGWSEQMRHLADARVLYDDVVKDTPYALPRVADPFEASPALAKGVSTSVAGLFAAAAKDPNGAEAARIALIASVTGLNADPASFLTTLLAYVVGITDVNDTAGGSGVSNIGVTYTSALLDPAATAALNESVMRYPSTPAGEAYLRDNYAPTGDFKVKLLSFHNTIDPLVPYKHEAILHDRVIAAGNTQNLIQQIVTTDPHTLAPKHCDFTADQWRAAWTQLRAWAEEGVTPPNGVELPTPAR